MAKNKKNKRPQYISKGTGRNVARVTVKAVRRARQANPFAVIKAKMEAMDNRKAVYGYIEDNTPWQDNGDSSAMKRDRIQKVKVNSETYRPSGVSLVL